MAESRAVFLDRDGVLIRDVGYLDSLDRIEIMPGVVDAIKRLRAAGFFLIVVTNQSGVARGLLDEEFVARTHEELARRFSGLGATIDGWYYCPHYEGGAVSEYAVGCECRKPGPGMALRARDDFGIDLTASYVVGDKPSDVGLGRAVGAGTVLVGAEHADEPGPEPDLRAPSLAEAVDWIVNNSRKSEENSG